MLQKRQQWATAISIGLKGGALCYLGSIVFFFWGVIAEPTELTVLITTVLLLIGSVLLAPAMVFHYALKAAERADRENSW